MCLILSDNPGEDKQRFKSEHKEPFIAYKLVYPDGRAMFANFIWQPGLNVSDRNHARLTRGERRKGEVDRGFHLAIEAPKACDANPYQIPIGCGGRWAAGCYRLAEDTCRLGYNRVLQCRIDPEDIAAVGIWNGIKSIVVTKAFVEQSITLLANTLSPV